MKSQYESLSPRLGVKEEDLPGIIEELAVGNYQGEKIRAGMMIAIMLMRWDIIEKIVDLTPEESEKASIVSSGLNQSRTKTMMLYFTYHLVYGINYEPFWLRYPLLRPDSAIEFAIYEFREGYRPGLKHAADYFAGWINRRSLLYHDLEFIHKKVDEEGLSVREAAGLVPLLYFKVVYKKLLDTPHLEPMINNRIIARTIASFFVDSNIAPNNICNVLGISYESSPSTSLESGRVTQVTEIEETKGAER